jgi:hypothetical protein
MNNKMVAAQLLKLARQIHSYGEYEIAYRIPGKGGWKRKVFDSKSKMERWVDKLIEKEGDDVEINWSADNPD